MAIRLGAIFFENLALFLMNNCLSMGKYFMVFGIYTNKFSHNLLNYALVFNFSDAVILN